MMRYAGAVVFGVFVLGAFLAGRMVEPVWSADRTELQTETDAEGELYFIHRGERRPVSAALAAEASVLWTLLDQKTAETPPVTEKVVVWEGRYYQLRAYRHWGVFSLLPAAAAVFLCFLLREPVVALAGGILSGAMLMRLYDVPDQVLIPGIGTATGATIVILYLWFLGGLMGVWARNGAALAFAEWVTRIFVRGPRSAKFVTWLLGAAFFQGGTLSTVLVGTTVRPLSDKQKVSHEELSYVVDSTASPIAIVLPFNVWPLYVAAFTFVAGVPFLATEADRIQFFFTNIPLYFYAIFALLFTFLMCFDKLPFISRQFRDAMRRSRETGQLDRPGAEPLLSAELENADPPAGYRPHLVEFVIPLTLIIGVTVGTFFLLGAPKTLWGFGSALVVAMIMALARGMALRDLMEGFTTGLKGVVYGSVVLLLAVIVGGVSRDAGAGPFLVELVGGQTPHWLLPGALMLMTMVIAFSTGTSFGTFAVALPLAMPLAWAVGQAAGVAEPKLYMGICFAAVINGSVYGDQCSPISDTTVLSCVSTGTDLMDHVKTQIVPCTFAALLAVVLWTALTFIA